jgi:hypothetical protein
MLERHGLKSTPLLPLAHVFYFVDGRGDEALGGTWAYLDVGGMPVEEPLLPWLSGTSAALLLARAWLASRLRRGRR